MTTAHEDSAPTGEAGLLARMLPLLGTDARTEVGPGDDAAVLRLDSPRLVITTDTLVEGHDFLRRATTAHRVGAKAATQNLADVAAMGARPQALVVAISAPRDEEPWVFAHLTAGCAEQAARWGASVVGGDLGSAEQLTITLTAVGSLPEGATPLTRGTARAGDALAVGGPRLGRSAAGLALLLADRVRLPFDGGSAARPLPGAEGTAPSAEEAELLLRHDDPRPDLALGWAPGARAQMDLSDGLVRDGRRLADASGLVVDLDPDALAPDVAALRGLAESLGQDPWEWVLHGGEEHLMLAAGAPEDLPAGFRPVGRLRAPDASVGPGTVLLGGRAVPGPGFDHFA